MAPGGPRIVELRERWVCAVQHRGPLADVDRTRRPLYRHMIVHELVGGPSILRFLEPPQGEHLVDALVVTHAGFEGDEVCRIERLPPGRYAVEDYEGPESGLDEARQRFRQWCRRQGATGEVLQVHLMDAMDGLAEQQFQALLP